MEKTGTKYLNQDWKKGYWIKKIERNMERDSKNDKVLLFLGWTVIHFWGSEIQKNIEECVKVIEESIFDNMIHSSDSL